MSVSSPFKQDFRKTLAENLLSDFAILSGNSWYLGISKLDSWVSAGVANDNVPNTDSDTIFSDTDFWRGCLAFKKINKEDVSLVVPRYDWVAGSVYAPYRDTVDLYDDASPSQFYALVDEERVYKCIDNNNGGISTVAPTHTDYQIRTLADNYRWKYLYSISETRRKFLTKSNTSSPGYMPVEYIETINENDDRILQWNVQNAAVDGSIDYIALNPTSLPYVISDGALFYDSGNEVIGGTAAGATGVVLGGSKLVKQSGYYDGMVLKIESGAGVGQYRTISSFELLGNGTALARITEPLNYGVSGGASPSLYSILPAITISGDGSAASNILNTYSSSAEVTPVFSTGVSGSGEKYLSSIEIINNGENYSYASLNIVKGLTFATGFSGSFSDFATPVMSPIGGHGSNPVNELGASSIMISTTLSEDESGEITVLNDYRRFALVKNPELRQPYVRMNLAHAGVSGSYTVGATVNQGLTAYDGSTSLSAASGTVYTWIPGTVGTTGTSELTVYGVSGNFHINGILGGITASQILTIKNLTIAGEEGRILRRLKLFPISSTFDPSGNDFVLNYYAFAGGNSGSNVSPSYANGKIYDWQPEAGTNAVGNLYLENSNGEFVLNELVYQNRMEYAGLSGPKGKIVEIDEEVVTVNDVYNQTLKLNLQYDGSNLFSSTSFTADSLINSSNGSGYVVDFVPATGATSGILSLLNTSGTFDVADYVIYNGSSSTGSSISAIVSQPKLKYRSGNILHAQNIRPIERSIEQKEDIKLIIQF